MALHAYVITDQVFIAESLKKHLKIYFHYLSPVIDYLSDEDLNLLALPKDNEVFIIRFGKPVETQAFTEAIEVYGLIKGYETSRGKNRVYYKHRKIFNKSVVFTGNGYLYDVYLEDTRT